MSAEPQSASGEAPVPAPAPTPAPILGALESEAQDVLASLSRGEYTSGEGTALMRAVRLWACNDDWTGRGLALTGSDGSDDALTLREPIVTSHAGSFHAYPRTEASVRKWVTSSDPCDHSCLNKWHTLFAYMKRAWRPLLACCGPARPFHKKRLKRDLIPALRACKLDARFRTDGEEAGRAAAEGRAEGDDAGAEALRRASRWWRMETKETARPLGSWASRMQAAVNLRQLRGLELEAERTLASLRKGQYANGAGEALVLAMCESGLQPRSELVAWVRSSDPWHHKDLRMWLESDFAHDLRGHVQGAQDIFMSRPALHSVVPGSADVDEATSELLRWPFKWWRDGTKQTARARAEAARRGALSDAAQVENAFTTWRAKTNTEATTQLRAGAARRGAAAVGRRGADGVRCGVDDPAIQAARREAVAAWAATWASEALWLVFASWVSFVDATSIARSWASAAEPKFEGAEGTGAPAADAAELRPDGAVRCKVGGVDRPGDAGETRAAIADAAQQGAEVACWREARGAGEAGRAAAADLAHPDPVADGASRREAEAADSVGPVEDTTSSRGSWDVVDEDGLSSAGSWELVGDDDAQPAAATE